MIEKFAGTGHVGSSDFSIEPHAKRMILVSLMMRKFAPNLARGPANFGIGTLV
jgi:hypothetical protein